MCIFHGVVKNSMSSEILLMSMYLMYLKILYSFLKMFPTLRIFPFYCFCIKLIIIITYIALHYITNKFTIIFSPARPEQLLSITRITIGNKSFSYRYFDFLLPDLNMFIWFVFVSFKKLGFYSSYTYLY